MIVLLSGEGPTDLGQCNNSQGTCEQPQFQLGPMTVLLDQLIESKLDYSPRSFPGVFQYVSETELQAQSKQRTHRSIVLPGKKKGQETGYFHINALTLGTLAQNMAIDQEDQVIAVLFRDCDGTRSSKTGLWADKCSSMMDGFSRSGFEYGVPMLPNPTSEAWLLCAAKGQPYQNCHALENLPGNMASANHPKHKLAEAFGHQKTAQELCDWLDGCLMDFTALTATMPSFAAFRNRLDDVISQT